MTYEGPVRWGILSTANIARSAFLPALRAVESRAVAVASRQAESARQFAEANNIERSLGNYEALIEDPAIEAIYIPLPNSLHAPWTTAALEAGKAVLCEKPLCLSVDETAHVLQTARNTNGLLWEAFVFPFRQQTDRIHQIITSGKIGVVQEIQSSFHFAMRNRQNIRLEPALGGGAMYDVGCYPVHLGTVIFDAIPDAGTAMAIWAPEGVDDEMQAVLDYAGGRRLVVSCGFRRTSASLTRIIGTEGEIRLTNPFHPGPQDTLEVRTGEGTESEQADPGPSFTAALRHINAVIRGEESPRHLAINDSMPTAVGIELCRRSAETHREERAATL